jgi:hypothetical protein
MRQFGSLQFFGCGWMVNGHHIATSIPLAFTFSSPLVGEGRVGGDSVRIARQLAALVIVAAILSHLMGLTPHARQNNKREMGHYSRPWWGLNIRRNANRATQKC